VWVCAFVYTEEIDVVGSSSSSSQEASTDDDDYDADDDAVLSDDKTFTVSLCLSPHL